MTVASKRITEKAPAPVAAKSPARKAISLEIARNLCPQTSTAETIASRFGLELPDFAQIRAAHHSSLVNLAATLETALNERALEMHYQRLTSSFVSSAVNAGRFYDDKKKEARAAAAILTTLPEDTDPDDRDSQETKAERLLTFAAEMAMQAYTLLATAEGAVTAHAEVTGSEWTPYIAPAEGAQATERRSPADDLAIFD
jgi:hypothetical protein